MEQKSSQLKTVNAGLRKRLILYLPAFMLISGIGCSLLYPPAPMEYNYDFLYVDGVTIPEIAGVNDSFPIQINGHFPDPSWSFDHFEFELDRYTLTVKPIGRKDLTLETVAQVLVPFEQLTSYSVKTIGMMNVHVIGKTDTIKTRIQIIAKR